MVKIKDTPIAVGCPGFVIGVFILPFWLLHWKLPLPKKLYHKDGVV